MQLSSSRSFDSSFAVWRSSRDVVAAVELIGVSRDSRVTSSHLKNKQEIVASVCSRKDICERKCTKNTEHSAFCERGSSLDAEFH